MCYGLGIDRYGFIQADTHFFSISLSLSRCRFSWADIWSRYGFCSLNLHHKNGTMIKSLNLKKGTFIELSVNHGEKNNICVSAESRNNDTHQKTQISADNICRRIYLMIADMDQQNVGGSVCNLVCMRSWACKYTWMRSSVQTFLSIFRLRILEMLGPSPLCSPLKYTHAQTNKWSQLRCEVVVSLRNFTTTWNKDRGIPIRRSLAESSVYYYCCCCFFLLVWLLAW